MAEKQYHIIYRTVNTLTGKEYIGVHSTNDLDDGYIGTGKYIGRAIKKYGKDIFERQILSFHKDRSAALQRERALVNRKYLNETHTYNIRIGGEGGFAAGKHHPHYGKPRSEATKRKIGEKSRGRIASPETLHRLSVATSGRNNPMYGKRGKNSPLYGRKHSDESKRKMSEALKGRTFSDETKRKMSEARRGKLHTEETRRKMSEAKMGEKNAHFGKRGIECSWYGSKRSEETRRKMSEWQIGKIVSNETRRKISERARLRPRSRHCEHCDRSFTAAMYARWHGDRCKMKP